MPSGSKVSFVLQFEKGTFSHGLDSLLKLFFYKKYIFTKYYNYTTLLILSSKLIWDSDNCRWTVRTSMINHAQDASSHFTVI
jgi:hypothetical protein